MPGYFGHSKSNNAIAAEADGRFPASVLADRLGVKLGAIRQLLRPTEWHHTSKYFNLTDYYSEESALEIIDALRAWHEPATGITVLENCSGSYLEWSGTRNHPQARTIQFGPVRVTRKGKWYILELPAGPIRKGADTRGFHLFDSANRPLTFNR